MVLKVYGSMLSTCTQVVVTTLKELKVPYEVVTINFATGEHKSENYTTTKQPFGQVPVLVEEDGFQLFESRAIARYVIAKFGPDSGLIPKGDLKALGKFEQAESIEYSNFYPFASGLAAEKIFKPMRGLKGSEELALENKTTLEAKLKAYESILSKQKFLAGDEFTLADLLHLSYGTLITEQCGFTALTSGELPNVARWWKDVSSRETWTEVVAERNAVYAAMKK